MCRVPSGGRRRFHRRNHVAGKEVLMAKLTINKEACKGCGLCVTACPKKILRVSTTVSNNQGYFVVEEIDPASCIACAFCATMCPDCVIKVEK